MKNPLLAEGTSLYSEGPERVYRGGSWISFARLTSVSYRYGGDASLRYDSRSFRLFRSTGQK